MRDPRMYLEDMLEAIGRISRHVHGKSFEEFERDELVVDGVVQNKRTAVESEVRRILRKLPRSGDPAL